MHPKYITDPNTQKDYQVYECGAEDLLSSAEMRPGEWIPPTMF